MKRGACMIPMSKKKKLRIVLGTYACALIAALGIFSYVSWRNLRDYRLAARYSAQEAFEETVAAVDHMSAALKKKRLRHRRRHVRQNMLTGLCRRACGGGRHGHSALLHAGA